jgi:hypothetical protein
MKDFYCGQQQYSSASGIWCHWIYPGDGCFCETCGGIMCSVNVHFQWNQSFIGEQVELCTSKKYGNAKSSVTFNEEWGHWQPGVSKHKIVHILLGHNKYRFLCLTRPGNCSLHLSLPWDLICDLKGLVYIAWQLVIHPLAGDCPAGIEYKCTIMLENAANYSTTCMNATHLIGLPPSFPLTLDSWSTNRWSLASEYPKTSSLAREAQLLRSNRVPMMLCYTDLLNSRHQFLHLCIALDVRKENKIHDFTWVWRY